MALMKVSFISLCMSGLVMGARQLQEEADLKVTPVLSNCRLSNPPYCIANRIKNKYAKPKVC